MECSCSWLGKLHANLSASPLQPEPFLEGSAGSSPSLRAMGTTEATLRMENVDVKEEWQDEDFPRCVPRKTKPGESYFFLWETIRARSGKVLPTAPGATGAWTPTGIQNFWSCSECIKNFGMLLAALCEQGKEGKELGVEHWEIRMGTGTRKGMEGGWVHMGVDLWIYGLLPSL